MKVVLHPPGHWERIWADAHRHHELLTERAPASRTARERTLAEELEFGRLSHLMAFDRFCSSLRRRLGIGFDLA